MTRLVARRSGSAASAVPPLAVGPSKHGPDHRPGYCRWADWLCPARYPRDRRSRAPLAILLHSLHCACPADGAQAGALHSCAGPNGRIALMATTRTTTIRGTTEARSQILQLLYESGRGLNLAAQLSSRTIQPGLNIFQFHSSPLLSPQMVTPV